MDYSEFVAAYPRTPSVVARYDARREALLGAPREFARFFGTALHDHFAGREPELSAPRFAGEVRQYLEWMRANLGAVIRSVERSGNRFDRHQPLVEMTFHQLTQMMHQIWVYELYGAPVLNGLHVRDMQLRIAMGATAMGGVRHRRSVNSQYFADYNTPLRRVQNGILTEMDAAVVLLEISRQLPHITVLPAPPQFENSSTGHNVDFLVMDRRVQKVVGVQVKTSVSRATVDRYDPEGIVLLDGVVDLGNTRPVQLRPESSETTVVPWPGLVSAHHVAALRPGSPALQPYPRELVAQSRKTARTVAHGTRSYNDTAVNHVAGRVLARLYSDGAGDDPVVA